VRVRVKLGHSDAAIRSDCGELIFSLNQGTFAVMTRDGAAAVAEATARVVLSEQSHALSAGYHRMAESIEVTGPFGDGMSLRVLCEPEGSGPRLVFSATMYEDLPGWFLSLQCENTLEESETLRSLEVLRATSSEGAHIEMFPYPPAVRFYHTGATMAGSPFVDLANPPLDLKEWADSTASDMMGCFAKDSVSTNALLAGFVTTGRLPSQIRFGLEPGGDQWRELLAVSECEGRVFPRGASTESELLYVNVGENALDSMDRYASILGRLMNARVPRETPTGWSSWHYFHEDVTEEDILANLRYIAEQRDRYPLRYVRIDEGYQKHWGDWLEPSSRFPGGVRSLAKKIRDFGFVPGLWVAPFVASRSSELAQKHDDWLVPDSSGDLLKIRGWGEECPWYALDGTHPDVRAHLEKTFRVMAEEWGIGYFDLDAMHVGAPPGAMFRDPRATRFEAYRRGLEAIRRGCGDALLAGCNAPFGPSVGLVDTMRVSMDAGPEWGASAGCNARSALRSSLRRAFFNRKLWLNDPDGLIVRGPERASIHYKNGLPEKTRTERPGLTLEEATTLASAVGMLGGAVFLSDDMQSIGTDRASLHEMLFPPESGGARPLDLFEHDPPSLLAASVTKPWGSWAVVAVINWQDFPTDRILDVDRLGFESPAAPCHVFSVYEEHYYGTVNDTINLGRIPPHGVRVVTVCEVLGRPQLLGSTLHVGQHTDEIPSSEWHPEERMLRLTLSPARARRAKLFFWLPTDAGEAAIGGSITVKSVKRDGNVLAVEIETNADADLQVSIS
jgi:hypothetical protein